ncbi:MAG: DUF1972 domain-containing protein, partial [Luteibaculum sp.]
MKIGILGTRGIPNEYGGFEQFAEYLSVDLVQRGHEVWVYNSSLHQYKEKTFKGVNLISCYDAEAKLGTAGQFIYDLNCIIDSRKRSFDVLLQLGYTSSAIWHPFLPKSKSIIVTNMDGLEWKRSKYSPKVQRFLKWSEKAAVKSSHHLVADSLGIKKYLEDQFGVASTFIAYGATPVEEVDPFLLDEFELAPRTYDMILARMEPENNIENLLKAWVEANIDGELIIIGRYNNSFGSKLYQEYKSHAKIRWLGPVYDINKLDALRWNSRFYFHGHSVGGTNPSLLEAMASKAFIIANDNPFNKAVLEDKAYYFSGSKDLAKLLQQLYENQDFGEQFREDNWRKIKDYENDLGWIHISQLSRTRST